MRLSRSLLTATIAAILLLPTGAAVADSHEDGSNRATVEHARTEEASGFNYNRCDDREGVWLGDGFYNFVVRETRDGGTSIHFNSHSTGIGEYGSEYVENFTLRDTSTEQTVEQTAHTVLVSHGAGDNEIRHFDYAYGPEAGEVVVENDRCVG